jgi:hypothetical protein
MAKLSGTRCRFVSANVLIADPDTENHPMVHSGTGGMPSLDI